MIVELDKLGRIVLKKELRDRFGKQFIIFPRKEEIVLKPFSMDEDELSKKLEKYSIKELKEIAEKESLKEIEGNTK